EFSDGFVEQPLCDERILQRRLAPVALRHTEVDALQPAHGDGKADNFQQGALVIEMGVDHGASSMRRLRTRSLSAERRTPVILAMRAAFCVSMASTSASVSASSSSFSSRLITFSWPITSPSIVQCSMGIDKSGGWPAGGVEAGV